MRSQLCFSMLQDCWNRFNCGNTVGTQKWRSFRLCITKMIRIITRISPGPDITSSLPVALFHVNVHAFCTSCVQIQPFISIWELTALPNSSQVRNPEPRSVRFLGKGKHMCNPTVQSRCILQLPFCAIPMQILAIYHPRECRRIPHSHNSMSLHIFMICESAYLGFQSPRLTASETELNTGTGDLKKNLVEVRPREQCRLYFAHIVLTWLRFCTTSVVGR